MIFVDTSVFYAQLAEDDAAELAVELTYKLVKRAYKL